MILVDTSVWVEHLRRGLPRLATLLQDGEVLIHPWVSGELACGNLCNRPQVLELLLVRGIGYLDAQLLASARLCHCRLWTQDRRLAAVAEEQGLAVGTPGP